MKKILLFFVLFVILIAGVGFLAWQQGWISFGTLDKNKLSMQLKNDAISNFENIRYLKVNADITASFDQDTQEFSSTGEKDYVNKKTLINFSYTLNGVKYTPAYYREGDTQYYNLDGTWQKNVDTAPIIFLDNSIDAAERLKNLSTLNYVKEDKLNGVDSFLLKSDMSQEESLALLNKLFKGAIIGSDYKFNVKNGETLWWINRQTKQLSSDIRTIDAEVDGHSIRVVFNNSYYDYNVPLNVETPAGIK